ncbi:hypothetical protein [Natronincola ferrireducens]|uniref:Uncharacterized protein n=1 Tax=Natronincola ferrireducens TaxID=393762 RepID=A0A1G8Z595_9FIRM|nr:hypothetical protein [Natronincola ferrireducens]SDK09410.1 hypothetical protein SAMN05660472_00720 [Natronincola ferrireducens]
MTPFKNEILTLRSEGITYKELTEGLRAKGYKGSVAALRVVVFKEKRIAKDLLKHEEPWELIDKRATGLYPRYKLSGIYQGYIF